MTTDWYEKLKQLAEAEREAKRRHKRFRKLLKSYRSLIAFDLGKELNLGDRYTVTLHLDVPALDGEDYEPDARPD